MAIQTTPTTSQAVDYLTATVGIPVGDMSRSMYRLLNSCARVYPDPFAAVLSQLLA